MKNFKVLFCLTLLEYARFSFLQGQYKDKGEHVALLK
jgi:hypothetical protein